MTESDETAWLIETEDRTGNIIYFADKSCSDLWTRDVNKAEKFADELLAKMCIPFWRRHQWRVTEHKWISR